MTFHSFDGIRSTQPTVLLTQQAPVRRGPRASATSLVVRRGPRASATSLVTVSLTESEAVLLTQQAPVRRGPRASATSLFTVSLAESETVLLTQQAPVRRGPRASANSLVTVLMASVLPNLRYYLRSKHLFAEVPVPRRPLFSRFRSQNPKRTLSYQMAFA